MLVSDFGLTYTYAHGRAFVRASRIVLSIPHSTPRLRLVVPIVRIKVKTKVE